MRESNGGKLISDKRDSKIVQMFLKVKSEKEFNDLMSMNQYGATIYKALDMKYFAYNDNFFIVITHYYGNDKIHIDGYMSMIYDWFKALGYIDLMKKDFEIKYKNNVIIEKHSLQPKVIK